MKCLNCDHDFDSHLSAKRTKAGINTLSMIFASHCHALEGGKTCECPGYFQDLEPKIIESTISKENRGDKTVQFMRSEVQDLEKSQILDRIKILDNYEFQTGLGFSVIRKILKFLLMKELEKSIK